MKFSEIKKFTPDGNYCVNQSIDYLQTTLDSYKEKQEKSGFKFELNPDFQRGHVWTEKQQIAFMEYLFRGGQSGRDIYFNHPGWQGNYIGDMVCVDGLQRLTAALRFLNNEIPIFGCYLKDFTDRLPSNIYFNFHVNNLKTRKELLKWYIEMNSGGTVHTDEEINRVTKMLEECK